MSDGPAGISGLADLPGVCRQLGGVVADLDAGLNCVWLLPDRLVDSGQADELYLRVLSGAPLHIDVPSVVDEEPGSPTEHGPLDEPLTGLGYGADADQLPYLDSYDDGFDLGWEADAYAPVIPAPRSQSLWAPVPLGDLAARIAKEISAPADDVVARLVTPEAGGRGPVIGIRAWGELEDGPLRGTGIERFYRSLSTAAKAAGLPPAERPRLLVAARLGDLPSGLPDELHLDSGVTAVHWWWGALGRLDISTAVVACLGAGTPPTGHERDSLGDRIVRQLTVETVVEVCGPDLELAQQLAFGWDGRQGTLETALRQCLVADTSLTGAYFEVPARMGARRRPGADMREAWSRGAIAEWEGQLRMHPATWCPADPATELTGVARARLTALVAQAQQRVVLPWIEEARRLLAARSLRYLRRPVENVVHEYIERPASHLRTQPEHAFLEIQVGELLYAHRQGAVALPPYEARLLRLLVKVRNILSHRSVLHDTTLRDLCGELARFDLLTS
ncbi:hypothetical protein ACFV6B_38475 [Streptomyces microflavus]|uniref:hypothetical protein n=1 Tax=Streptomyces microflavus TaxID=1919 RepID=UPI00365DC8C9